MSLIDIKIQTQKFPTGNSNNFREMNALLAKDDYIETRCGEIFMSRCKILIFLCSECNENFSSYDEFFNHLCEQHVSIDDELKYEPEDEDEYFLEAEYCDENLIVEMDDDQDEEDVKPILTENLTKNAHSKDDVSQDVLLQDYKQSQDDGLSQDDIQDYEEIDEFEAAINKPSEENKTVTFLNDFSKFLEKDCREIVDDELPEKKSSESTSNLPPEIDPFRLDSLTDVDKFECDRCQLVFDSASELRIHTKTHAKDRRFKCHICGFAFTEHFNLRSHLKRHNGNKPFACKLCEKRFITRNELRAHERIHTGERPYICEICGNGFVTSGSLNEHRKRHNNFRPHKCSMCEKSFFDTGMLREHMVVHTGERSHVCEVCQAAFTRRKALLQHLKLHSGVKQYKCLYCEKAFAQKPGLASHLKTHRNVHDFEKLEQNYIDVIEG